MPPETANGWADRMLRQRGLLVPLFIVSAVLLLFTPLPPLAMDFLLACNVTISVVILLTTIYVDRPLDFSVFPTILLGTTLARLVLNVASTRLILTGAGERGTGAAGGVIEAFGLFVSGDNVVVGLIIFVIIVVIQFVVITKGATRIGEVTARFALDGMPGKQMSIDADLAGNLITPEQAQQRRQEVTEQADFYAAMDGASKFVRGDAIAGIIITLINIAGGLYVGMVQQTMNFGRAVEVFTTLTIGDGLVSQVPAFLVSLAAGLIVTRTSSKSDLPKQVIEQVFAHPAAMFMSAGFLIILAFTGLPAIPLTGLCIGCSLIGWQIISRKKTEQTVEQKAEAERQAEEPEQKPEDNLIVDPLEVELGMGLLGLADPTTGSDLLERVVSMRSLMARELGILLPNVRFIDGMMLEEHEYCIKIRDNPVARDVLYPDELLAIDTGGVSEKIPGREVVEASDGHKAVWIEPGNKNRAEILGYYVVDPAGEFVMHLMEIVRNHAYEILTRDHVYQLVKNLESVAPKVVSDLIPETLTMAHVHKVLRKLLKERVPIRDLETILATLGDYGDRIKETDILVEYCRMALSRVITQKYRDEDGVLHVITIDPQLESEMAKAVRKNEDAYYFDLSPHIAEQLLNDLNRHLQVLMAYGHPPVLLCNPMLRSPLKRLTDPDLPQLNVLSENEVASGTRIEAHGQLQLQPATAGT